MVELDKRESDISAKEKHVNSMENDLEGEIGKRVKKDVTKIEWRLRMDYDDRKQYLDWCYNKMEAEHLIGYYASIGGLILAVIGIIATSNAYRTEAVEFFSALAHVVYKSVTGPYNAGAFIGGKVFSRSVEPIGYWIIGVLVMIVLYGIMITLLVLLCRFLIQNFAEHMCDGITVAALEIVIGVPIFFAPLLVEMPINSLLLGLLLFSSYMLIRIFIAWDNEESKKEILKNLAYFVFLIVCFYLIVLAIRHI